jgi:hypothetical protein
MGPKVHGLSISLGLGKEILYLRCFSSSLWNLESASRLLIVLVIMTMQFGRINAFNEMCAGFKS